MSVKITALTQPEDMAWLTVVHGIPTDGYTYAELFGNEDFPDMVKIYRRNHVSCVPSIYRYPSPDAKRMVCTFVGDHF